MLQVLFSMTAAFTIFVLMSGMNLNARNDIHLLKKKLTLDNMAEESYIEVEKSIRAYGSVSRFWANQQSTSVSPRLRSMVTLRFVRNQVAVRDMQPRTALTSGTITSNGKTYTIRRSFHPMFYQSRAPAPDYIRVDAKIYEGAQLVVSKSKFFVD